MFHAHNRTTQEVSLFSFRGVQIGKWAIGLMRRDDI